MPEYKLSLKKLCDGPTLIARCYHANQVFNFCLDLISATALLVIGLLFLMNSTQTTLNFAIIIILFTLGGITFFSHVIQSHLICCQTGAPWYLKNWTVLQKVSNSCFTIFCCGIPLWFGIVLPIIMCGLGFYILAIELDFTPANSYVIGLISIITGGTYFIVLVSVGLIVVTIIIIHFSCVIYIARRNLKKKHYEQKEDILNEL
eukprot:gene9075-1170_t